MISLNRNSHQTPFRCIEVFCFECHNQCSLIPHKNLLTLKMESFNPETYDQEIENGDFSRPSAVERRDTSPGRPGKKKLEALLNGQLRIKMTDGRVLIGTFLCTDRDANVILGSCCEYLSEEDCSPEKPRILGLVMVPGRHIVSIHKNES